MIKVLATALLGFGISASSFAVSPVLVKLVKRPGFEHEPTKVEVVLSQDGIVTVTKTRMGQVGESTKIAQLSRVSVNKISTSLAALDGELYDENEGAPMCTDTPIISVEVNKGQETITIRKDQNCHSYKFTDYNAQLISDLMTGFFKLASM